MQNKYFRFISDDARHCFENTYSSNIDMANIIQNDIFKVIKVTGDNNIVTIQVKDGKLYSHGKDGIYITSAEIEEFFTEVSGFGGDSGLWDLNETYVCIDLKGLLSCSCINKRFVSLVGSQKFKVLIVDSITGPTRVKAIELNGEKINLSLVQNEREFFKLYEDYEISVISRAESIQEHFDSLDELDQVQDEIDELENNTKPADNPNLVVIEGDVGIRINVTSEDSRLEAIKFLEGIRFANV